MGPHRKGKAPKAFVPLGNEIVEILVGPDLEKFNLHKDRICDVSEYFRGLFKGNFKDATSNTTTLSEEDVDGFRLFQYVIYNNELPMNVEAINGIVGNDKAIQSIVKFYVLADQLVLEDHFKTQAIQAFTKITMPKGVNGPNHFVSKLQSSDGNTALLLLPDHDPFLQVVLDTVSYTYLKASYNAGVFGLFEKITNTPEARQELNEWLEDCLRGVSISRVALLFAALTGFTKGWNMSSDPAKELQEAVYKGLERCKVGSRYKIGYLRIADDVDDGRISKKAKLDDGKEEDQG